MKKKEETIIAMIDGTEYYFNLKKIFEFISYRTDKTEKQKEVVDSYDRSEEDEGEIKLSSKIVREITSPNESQYDNIKYDLVKTFIIQLITFDEKTTIPTGEDDKSIELPIINVNFMPLGTRIVFNTLVEEGLLIKKENKK